MSLLDRLDIGRRCDLSRHREFMIGAESVGWIGPDLAARLAEFHDTFVVEDNRVRLADRLGDFASRTRAVDRVLRILRDRGVVRGWRDEAYPVGRSFHGPPLMQMERAAVPLFGVRAYGIHVNGFVGRGPDMRLWVGRRAKSKPTWPGKLDHLVAGGQPIGLGLAENLLKECAEEASLPPALAGRAMPVGVVSYLLTNEEGVRNDVLFAYDLELPADFTPRNADGEIEEFFLWPIGRVLAELEATDNFKFNVAFVIIDFMIRRGVIGPERPDYLTLLAGLRRGVRG